MGFSNNNTCKSPGGNSIVDDFLAPVRTKMKVLKKFKRRIGLGQLYFLFFLNSK